ncbi:(+)-neomenthol dehydrogenase [Cryptomeria japonica]|uniref:(+)-neomenthol dehydrogenase n=1 Tax=Cryptomeria japonica TaxID=3369 RepID=UPI0027DA20E9|nr:(+)-neomenthol dehydrogenase [Cryptomeria japonica]
MICDDECECRWWTRETVAVVTGANKGIGFEIVRQLAENGLTVVLTSRDLSRGLRATKTLHDEGFNNVVFHELEIQNLQSVSEFAMWLKENYGGLDILVNNAGIFGTTIDKEAAIQAACVSRMQYDLMSDPAFSQAFKTNYEMSKKCIEINYYGTKRITEALLPLIRPEGRIVNVSSEAGLLKMLKNDSLQTELSNISKITEGLIDKMLEMFLHDMKSGNLEGKGWPFFTPHYSLSKIALNAYSRMLAQKLSERRIYVNNVHPGDVQTDMTDYLGSLTPSQGAHSCVMLALLPPGGPSGHFFFMKEAHSF